MPRPKEFDRNEALEAALHLFWEKGYQATSMQDLVDRMDMNRFSIYETFGSKHELFLSALDLYRRDIAGNLRSLLEDESKGLDAIKRYFRAMAKDLSAKGGRVGCFLQNSTLELALQDKAVEHRAQATNLSFQEAIHAALKRAQRRGEITSSKDLRPRARYLFSIGQGMIVIAKAHGDPKMIHDVSNHACELLESWR